MTRKIKKVILTEEHWPLIFEALEQKDQEASKTEPVLIPDDLTHSSRFWIAWLELTYGEKIWLYQNHLYAINKKAYTDREMRLLILEEADKERQKFERLKLKFDSGAAQEIRFSRPTIPEEIRVAVWRRDQGRCVRCSSRENLEYDHIIPLSKGGSNTVRNIELLCEKCNRQKGGRIQ